MVRFGVDRSWIVSEGGELGEAALELTHQGKSYRVAGRRFVLAAPADSAVRWEGRRYRGRLEVYLNDRGRLNLVNELPLEQYLRGVVPRELGPGAYPELEALKAQAVAARSYTLRNLGEFADEGYDLCGTPRCQVYGGMDDEHPLSDRAIAETAGEVLLYDGQPIDALYSATCGGHTENVEVIFPLKRAAYLRGVPCIEAGERDAPLRPPEGRRALPPALLDRVLPGLPGRARRRAGARAGSAPGWPPPPASRLPCDRLARSTGGRCSGFSARCSISRPMRGSSCAPKSSAIWLRTRRRAGTRRTARLAAYLVKSGLLASGFGSGGAAGADAARGRRSARCSSPLFLRAASKQREASFSSAVRDGSSAASASWWPRRRRRASSRAAGRSRDLPRRIGRRAAPATSCWTPATTLHALSRRRRDSSRWRRRSIRGARATTARTTSRSWTRFRSDGELARSVRTALPGFELRRASTSSMRGVSGRVGTIRLDDRERRDGRGRRARRALDARPARHAVHGAAARRRRGARPAGSSPAAAGATASASARSAPYGMARRGHDYRAILAHYYSGVALQKITYASPALAALPGIVPIGPIGPIGPIDPVAPLAPLPPPSLELPASIAAPGAAR